MYVSWLVDGSLDYECQQWIGGRDVRIGNGYVGGSKCSGCVQVKPISAACIRDGGFKMDWYVCGSRRSG